MTRPLARCFAGELLAVVDQTMQPAEVLLGFAPSATESRHGAGIPPGPNARAWLERDDHALGVDVVVGIGVAGLAGDRGRVVERIEPCHGAIGAGAEVAVTVAFTPRSPRAPDTIDVVEALVGLDRHSPRGQLVNCLAMSFTGKLGIVNVAGLWLGLG
jgi:hypothetical protein